MNTDYRWRVFVEIRSGFNPVAMLLFASRSLSDAFAYLESRQHLVTKKRHLFIKELGSRRRYSVDYPPSAYHDEPSDDDRAIVQLEHKSGVGRWRGRGVRL